MLIYPAIDILHGKCVRLTQGDYNVSTIYNENPIEVAKEIKKCGAIFLHIVDLDGAKKGEAVNSKIIFDICKSTGLLVQVGGGIRTYETASHYLNQGVERVILGTIALKDKALVEQLVKEYMPSRIVISVDVRGNTIATQGWLQNETIDIGNFIDEMKAIGVHHFIVTNIEKDGMLSGVDPSIMKPFVERGVDVIAAGGVSSLKDIVLLEKHHISGAIVGKAYYEGKIDLQKAIQRFPQTKLVKRVIACLDVKGNRVVKGTHFTHLRDAGDAVELGKLYSDKGIDELIFLDISATIEERRTLLHLVEQIAKEINIPFTVGGGVQTIEHIQNLLMAGADKISVGSKAITNPSFIKEASMKFGAQCIVISLDARRDIATNSWKLYIKGGSQPTNVDAIEFAKVMQEMGAGELLVNSLDMDGTKKGFDIEFLNKICDAVSLPVIASSGAGKMEDFEDVFVKTNVSAALAATIFHYREIEIEDLKKFLHQKNIPVRL